MLTPYLLMYLVISVFLAFLGWSAIQKNKYAHLNKLFFLFTINLILWLLTNYFSNSQYISLGAVRVANHLVLFFAGTTLLVLLNFCVSIAKIRRLEKRNTFLTYSLLAVYLSALTPLVVRSVSPQDNVYAIEFGVLSTVYFLGILLNAIGIVAVLIIGVRKNKGIDRTRLVTILWSLVIFLTLNIVTNVVVPILSGSFNLTNLGPLTSIVLVVGLFYSIVRHRLFDIRLIVARSIAYFLLLSTVILIFGFFVFYLSRRIIGIDNVFVRDELIPLVTSVVLAVLYQPLKSFFAKVTNSIFFRDAYDSQDFLDELNSSIVKNFELSALLKNAVETIERNLKSDYCAFIIRETSYSPERIVGDLKKNLSPEEIKKIREAVRHLKSKVIITDELADTERLHEVYTLLQQKDIAVVARLVSTLDYDIEGVGYLFLGPKKSGNPYSRQDNKVLDILANELVIAIENSLRFEEIEKFNITLQTKVDEATRELRRSNQKLKNLDETKDEFISMASHQLRTPLTSVKGYLSMVLEGDAGKLNDMQYKLLDQAFVSSQRMVFLIADLLNVSRLRTGKFIIEKMPVNLATLVDGEVKQLVETASSRGLALSYQKPHNFPVLMLDETKIRQVVMNFIDNAIYYTPSGGHIEIWLKETDKSIEFSVTDNGVGVPKSEQHHLFTKFYRAGNARKVRPDGTGLGLFMAKKVIVAQGGAVLFKSMEGKGSTFGFTFEKSKIAPPVIVPEDKETQTIHL